MPARPVDKHVFTYIKCGGVVWRRVMWYSAPGNPEPYSIAIRKYVHGDWHLKVRNVIVLRLGIGKECDGTSAGITLETYRLKHLLAIGATPFRWQPDFDGLRSESQTGLSRKD